MSTGMMLMFMITISVALSIDEKLHENDGESEQ